MAVRGFYINLDRSPDRRAQIEAELEKLAGIGAYERFAAVDGHASPLRPEFGFRGMLGCFLSHLGVLEANRDQGGDDWLHVIEDDALVSRLAAPVIETLAS